MEKSAISEKAGKSGSILLVEHEPLAAQEMRSQLAALGYRLSGCVTSGRAAIAAADSVIATDAIGYDLGQGFWYLKPCPAAQFHAWLSTR